MLQNRPLPDPNSNSGQFRKHATSVLQVSQALHQGDGNKCTWATNGSAFSLGWLQTLEHLLHSHRAGTAAPSAPVLSDDVQQESHAASEPPAFDWARNWYPVALTGDLNTERPSSLQLLGKQIAVWRDLSGVWNAVEDRCPHRYGLPVPAVLSYCWLRAKCCLEM